jgi:hypothetical protein
MPALAESGSRTYNGGLTRRWRAAALIALAPQDIVDLAGD